MGIERWESGMGKMDIGNWENGNGRCSNARTHIIGATFSEQQQNNVHRQRVTSFGAVYPSSTKRLIRP